MLKENRVAPIPPLAGDEPIAFAGALATWFADARRDLPWRRPENAADPYRILVSEIMLQQTTVAAVAPLYLRFIERFPNWATLAAASIDEVLALWAGLGYYQRARSLHGCARAVQEHHGGVFPRDIAQVMALPGIGRYTAGAVLSIACNQPAPIVDANVARLLSRVLCLEGNPRTPTNQRLLWAAATQVVEASVHCDPGKSSIGPATVNSALMELGALVCVPREPRCEQCPVEPWCMARNKGRERELPQLPPRPTVVPLHHACLFATRRGPSGELSVLVRQRPHQRGIWWRGMWELPRVTLREGQTAPAALATMAHEEFGLKATLQRQLKTLRHVVTHHQITLDCWQADVEGCATAGQWCSWAELDALAIPSTMRRLLTFLKAMD